MCCGGGGGGGDDEDGALPSSLALEGAQGRRWHARGDARLRRGRPSTRRCAARDVVGVSWASSFGGGGKCAADDGDGAVAGKHEGTASQKQRRRRRRDSMSLCHSRTRSIASGSRTLRQRQRRALVGSRARAETTGQQS